MKVKIDSDEAYPVWSVQDIESYGDIVDVDENTLIRWKRTFELFYLMQQEIARLHPDYNEGWYTWESGFGVMLDEEE